MMNCKHATRLLSESLERRLGPVEKGMLRLHTSMCSGCRQFGVQTRELRQICRAYTPIETAENDRDEDRHGR